NRGRTGPFQQFGREDHRCDRIMSAKNPRQLPGKCAAAGADFQDSLSGHKVKIFLDEECPPTQFQFGGKPLFVPTELPLLLQQLGDRAYGRSKHQAKTRVPDWSSAHYRCTRTQEISVRENVTKQGCLCLKSWILRF